MIAINELRIGNWVDTVTAGLADGIQVTGLYEGRICFGDGDMFEPKYVNPVELTPELLEKCGFERLPHFNIQNSMMKSIGRGRVISIGCVGTPNEMVFLTEEDAPKVNAVIVLRNFDYDGETYLHTLQNLFYTLTGEELNVEL